MAQQYETGHAKNVANFQKLIEQVTTYEEYNPAIEDLKITELQSLYNKSITSLDNIKEKRISNKDAIHSRQEIYKNLKSKATRIINYLDILNLKDGTFAQAKSLNKLIQGSNKTIKEVDEYNDDETKSKSTSRQSYTQIAENFSKLIQLLETIGTYNPNIDDIKINSLKSYHTDLVSKTQKVNQTEAELNTEFIERNNVLYNEDNGLFEIAQNVKKYVKSLYGAKSPEYTNVSKIKFTSI